MSVAALHGPAIVSRRSDCAALDVDLAFGLHALVALVLTNI